MNECYVGPISGLAGTVAAQRFSGDVQCAAMASNMASKPTGLTAAIQSLTAEVYEAGHLAENLASSLGLSSPATDKSSEQAPHAPIDFLRDAMRIMREANDKLTGVLQHINS